ncbi:hypothetical protein NX784_13665 [Massilia pinisoli]|uniref:YcxB-like C-terminal domain-containing protein n=1 Tax=Massilia pinisoli TaxID=1772194 RepID=A0ABT1ZRW0_9BURK|nr:YcxB family protein [Massilia pinisoli]MCS0582643.1 hypothetical protein [Massilia pinisoli]
MFGAGHPRPLHRKEVAMQVVRHAARHAVDHTLTVDPPDGRDAALPPASPATRFDVVYTLPEYLGFVHDHLTSTLRRMTPAQRLRQTLVPFAFAMTTLAIAWMIGPGWARTALLACGALALASLPAAVSAWVALIGTPVFVYKKRRMPHCAFRIDATGIERTTQAGTLVRSWAEIRGVRRYRRGVLLMYLRGAIPIPYRCLDRAQAAALRRFARARGGV